MGFCQADVEHFIGKPVYLYLFEIGDNTTYDEVADALIESVSEGTFTYYHEVQPTTYNTETKEWEDLGKVHKSHRTIPYERVAEIVIFEDD